MSEFAIYKNSKTGEIAKYLRCETVTYYRSSRIVHVLLVGGEQGRWSDDLFLKSWSRVRDDRTSDKF